MDKDIMRELLLLDLAGFRCGVWKEDILSHEEQSIHWLTSQDGIVTALAMMGAHPVSLADLSYCLGLTPARRARRCPVLVPADHDLSVSFVVEQEAGQVEVSASEIFPLPAYLQTSFISSCVEFDGKLIPLINIQAIQRQVSAGHYSPPVPPLHRSFQQDALQENLQKESTTSLDTLRVFTCKKKSFVASAGYFSSDPALTPGPLTTLPLLPDFVQGISLYRHQILIVLDLRRYLQLPSEQNDEEGKWLVGTVEGRSFAFVVDADQGVLSADSGSFSLLPALIRSAWRQQAFLYERKILSVLDFRELLTSSPDEIHSQAVSPHRPHVDADGDFEIAFGQQQVEILEFSLSSMIHALPAAEVEDTFPFSHCQRLTGTRGLIIGVTLYKEELLPVLDLARCFGRDSQPTSDWQLLLVCNGELRSLVLVEKVLGKRVLRVHEQRVLPFAAPQSSVYGCYPVAGRVGLILNTLALTVYFDDEQTSELFLFADELLPDNIEEQVIGSLVEGENNLLGDDFLEWKERDKEESLLDDGLGKGASALFMEEPIEEPDSLVQSVVASMLSQTTDASGAASWLENESKDGLANEDDPGTPDDFDGLVEESGDIFPSVVAALLSHKENDLVVDDEPINQGSQDVENDQNNQGDQVGAEEENDESHEILTSVENSAPLFAESNLLAEKEQDVDESSRNIQNPLDDEIQEDKQPPLLIFTEEQDALLQSTLATAFSQDRAKEDALQTGEAAEEEREEGDKSDVVEESTPPVSSAEVERVGKDDVGKDEKKEDLEKQPEKQSSFLKEQEQVGQFEGADVQEQKEGSAKDDALNVLEDTGSFPELKEFSQRISKTQQGSPFLNMPHTEFVRKVKFPALSSPDPRKIKEQLDKVRQKERDVLFRGVAHDLAEGSQALQPEEKKDCRVRMWLFFILIGLFLAFQVWLFAFRGQDEPRGKSIKSTDKIIGISRDSSPVVRDKVPVRKEERKEDEPAQLEQIADQPAGDSDQDSTEQAIEEIFIEQSRQETSVQKIPEKVVGKISDKPLEDVWERRNDQEEYTRLDDLGGPDGPGREQGAGQGKKQPMEETDPLPQLNGESDEIDEVTNREDNRESNEEKEKGGSEQENKRKMTENDPVKKNEIQNKRIEKDVTALLRGVGRGDSELKEAKISESLKNAKPVKVTGEKKEAPELKKTPDHGRHTVNKGETLWEISEQYTGSGFNYLDVAKENKITNPDLIYPDQQVTLPEPAAPPAQN